MNRTRCLAGCLGLTDSCKALPDLHAPHWLLPAVPWIAQLRLQMRGTAAAASVPRWAACWRAHPASLCWGLSWYWTYSGPSPASGSSLPCAEEVGGIYAEGGVMEIKIAITAHHNGRFQFRICRIQAPGPGQTWAQAEKAQLTNECFNQVGMGTGWGGSLCGRNGWEGGCVGRFGRVGSWLQTALGLRLVVAASALSRPWRTLSWAHLIVLPPLPPFPASLCSTC